ncbi:MAG: hypothetical protein JNJ78_11265 [Anaerolineae bacterium]|nr:hypothetical protein [Anaerolineae bacterium]
MPHGSRTRRCTPRRGAKTGTPRGSFVVVVVVVPDKESGGNERRWRRQGFFPVGGYAVVKVRSVTLMERTP